MSLTAPRKRKISVFCLGYFSLAALRKREISVFLLGAVFLGGRSDQISRDTHMRCMVYVYVCVVSAAPATPKTSLLLMRLLVLSRIRSTLSEATGEEVHGGHTRDIVKLLKPFRARAIDY